jgi:hypothetical protein
LVFRHFLAIGFEHLDLKTWDRPSLALRLSPQTLRRFSALLLFSSGFLLPPLAFVRATATSVVKLPAWLPATSCSSLQQFSEALVSGMLEMSYQTRGGSLPKDDR